MTAIDVAVQAKRLGAELVTIVYRRGQEHMKASDYEQELAQTNGVQLRSDDEDNARIFRSLRNLNDHVQARRTG